ncbi:hypothetical protein PMZ80_004733 [Knufia obscura]|uniref:Uncharacterized protein n=1 Tax=Knufia obscura TaxID=1635080 RepID=A0ABR0RSZ8_9EURO|nr:hypothetical protein PMZ80_004733 [Knufia obscura]
MSSIPHQFHDELIDHATLPLYNWDQALAESEARQAAADAEHFDRYQDRSASQYPTVAHHASHNGWAEPDDLTQPCHTTQYNDIRVHGGEDAYFDPSSKHAGHGSWIDSKFESGVQAGWYEQADPQHRQRPPQEYAARAVTLAGEHEPDRRVAVAAPEQASFAYQAGPAARHNRAYYQAQAHQNQNVSQRPLNEFLGPPTVSNRASPLPSSQRLAARPPPRTLPPQPGATRYQHVNASTTSRQSSVTRNHGPALTVTPLPDGPRIHHPSLIYTIEEEDEDDFFNVRPHIHRPSLRVAEETTNHNHNHNHNHRDNRVSSVGHAAQSATVTRHPNQQLKLKPQASASPSSTPTLHPLTPLSCAFTRLPTPDFIDPFETGRRSTRIISPSVSPKTIPLPISRPTKRRHSSSPTTAHEREARPSKKPKFIPTRKWSPTRLRELMRRERPRNLPEGVEYSDFEVVREVPIGELVNEWTEVAAENGGVSGYDGGDERGCGEVSEEDLKKWTVNMSVGSRVFAADVPVQAAEGKIPFKLRVEDEEGTVLWDMSWSWYGD